MFPTSQGAEGITLSRIMTKLFREIKRTADGTEQDASLRTNCVVQGVARSFDAMRAVSHISIFFSFMTRSLDKRLPCFPPPTFTKVMRKLLGVAIRGDRANAQLQGFMHKLPTANMMPPMESEPRVSRFLRGQELLRVASHQQYWGPKEAACASDRQEQAHVLPAKWRDPTCWYRCLGASYRSTHKWQMRAEAAVLIFSGKRQNPNLSGKADYFIKSLLFSLGIFALRSGTVVVPKICKSSLTNCCSGEQLQSSWRSFGVSAVSGVLLGFSQRPIACDHANQACRIAITLLALLDVQDRSSTDRERERERER